jgi:protein ImuB
MRLFAEKLPRLEAAFGFDLLMLKALEVAPLAPPQVGNDRARRQQSTSELLDRLTARLGAHAVCRLKHRHSHLPERAQSLASAGRDDLDWRSLPMDMPPRPIRLLPRPEPIDVLAEVPEGAPMRFRWRRVEHRVRRAQGPERIASEWWIDPEELTRDYYQVEVTGGPRFWLFRRGLYAVPGVRTGEKVAQSDKPAWYLHGFFA